MFESRDLKSIEPLKACWGGGVGGSLFGVLFRGFWVAMAECDPKRQDLQTQDDQKRAQASEEEVGPPPPLQIFQGSFGFGVVRGSRMPDISNIRRAFNLGVELCCICKNQTSATASRHSAGIPSTLHAACQSTAAVCILDRGSRRARNRHRERERERERDTGGTSALNDFDRALGIIVLLRYRDCKGILFLTS